MALIKSLKFWLFNTSLTLVIFLLEALMLTNQSYLKHDKKAPRTSTAIPKLVAISFFAIAFILFFMRNTVLLLNPTVFAEDGVWTGMGMEHG